MKKEYCRGFMLLAAIALLPVSMSSVTQAQEKTLIMATTTSTQDTGLLDVLLPFFEKKTGYFVKTIAVGSGQSITMGRRGRRMCCWCTLLRRRRNSWRMGLGSAEGLSCTMTTSSQGLATIRPRSKG